MTSTDNFFALYEKDNFTLEYTDIAAIALFIVCEEGVRAADHLNIKTKMAADRKQKSRLVIECGERMK